MPKSFLFLLLVAGFFIQSCQAPTSETEQSETTTPKQDLKIVSLSGLITEVLFELGYGDQIIAVDITSTYPEKTKDLESLGHVTNLNVEALLKLQPDFLFYEAQQKGQIAFEQLEDAGIKVVPVPTYFGMGNASLAAKTIAENLEVDPTKVEAMNIKIAADSLALQELLAYSKDQPKALFIYARGAGRVLAAGQNTSMDAMIELAGGENVIQSFEGFKALTPESIIQNPPEIILMFDSGLSSLDGIEGLATIPGLEKTPAIQHQQVFTMDGHLMSAFGPRSGEAAKIIAEAFQNVP
ncbi:MAG: ABC transporter substrate-binding protein [Bacteroidota bacterium]